MSTARPSPAFLTVNSVAFLTSSVLASTALWPIYSSPRLVLLVAVTLAAGTLIGVLGAIFRWPSFTVFAATVVAFALLGVPLAVPSAARFGVLPTLDGLVDLALGAGLGWKQLLTIALPVGTYQGLMIPAFILVLLSTVIGLSISLRARYGELGILPPTALFLAAIAFGPDSAPFPIELALGFLTVTLLWIVWSRWYRRSASIRLLNAQNGTPVESASDQHSLGARSLIGAAATIAVALVAAVGATAYLPPSSERDVLRSVVVQPFDPRNYSSPLAGFRQYLKPDADGVVMLSVRGLPNGAGVRLATLDTYDGVVYSVGSEDVSSASGSFARVPYELDQSAGDGQRSTVDVTIGDYEGVWLPTVGQLERIVFTGPEAARLEDSFYYNDNTGTGVVTEGLAAGNSYRLTAVVPPATTDNQLAEAEPGLAELPELPVLPEELLPALESFVMGNDEPGARLVAMLDALRTTGYVSHGVTSDEPFSRSGHGIDRINELLTDNPMVGDSEQYAVTAALMANQLGFPARVVFGFRPGEDAREPGEDEPIELTGSDASAWIEINTLADGWVSVDPNPEVREIPDAQPDEPTVVSRPQSVVPPPAEERVDPDERTPPDTADEEQDPTEPWLATLLAILPVLGWTLLVMALILSPFLAIIAAKLRRRRRRRRTGTPLDRIRGGWEEFADTAADHGHELPRSATRTELARSVGGSAPLVLATVTDRAVFAPAPADVGQAEQVWRAVADLRASMGRGRTRWERIKALVSIRSFGNSAPKSSRKFGSS